MQSVRTVSDRFSLVKGIWLASVQNLTYRLNCVRSASDLLPGARSGLTAGMRLNTAQIAVAVVAPMPLRQNRSHTRRDEQPFAPTELLKSSSRFLKIAS
jgi:hypothetical protein